MSSKQAHIVYSGMVQGVGFRWTVERAANSLFLTGWVRNCPDGTVEVVCEGKTGDINVFMDKINKEIGHYIRKSDVKWREAKGEFDKFEIRFYSI